MMQDYHLLLEANEKVGFTMYERWFCFSTCKNNLDYGIDKLKKKMTPETAFSLEQDIFQANVNILKNVLQKLEIVPAKDEHIIQDTVEVLGTNIKFNPKIVIYPSFAVTLKELNEKIKGKISITGDATLLLMGHESIINDVYVAGSFDTVESPFEGEKINQIINTYVPLNEGEGENYEKIRGYTMVKKTMN